MKIKKPKFAIRDSQFGFTLIEAVVSAAVFAVAITGISGAYISVQRLNQTSASLQAIQQNIRFISEDLSKLVRNGQVDYVSYGGTAPQSAAYLYLLDRDGQKVQISLSGNNDLELNKPGIGKTNYNGREIKIYNFVAFVTPATNPFPGGTEQPTVTIYMEIEANISQRTKIRTPFQMTLSTWQYPQ